MKQNTLRVGIDASGLAASKSATGLQRYLGGLVTHLAARAELEGLNLYLYFARPIPAHRQAPGTVLAAVCPGSRIHWRVAPYARGWQRLGMGLSMHLDRLDLFHFPAPLMSGYCPIPAVVTFHDLAALSIEAEHTQRENRYLPAALDAARRAKTLIAVSDNTRDEIARHLGRTDALVTVEGVDLAHFRPAPKPEVEAIQARYNLERYILCVGTLQTRKNHLALIQAFERIQAQIPHSLVIAGGDGSGADAIRAYLADHPNLRVRLLGYIEDAALPALYTGADVLALPSLWEGFGLPLIEAMACGTSVLTSNVSSLAEVAGDAAMLINPRDIDDLARNLLLILTDSSLRTRLIEAGFRRSRMFSWERTAEQTVAIYRETMGWRQDSSLA